MRKLKRTMARTHMKDAKIPSINKRLYASKDPNQVKKQSFFSLHWREWIAGNPHKKNRRILRAARRAGK